MPTGDCCKSHTDLTLALIQWYLHNVLNSILLA